MRVELTPEDEDRVSTVVLDLDDQRLFQFRRHVVDSIHGSSTPSGRHPAGDSWAERFAGWADPVRRSAGSYPPTCGTALAREKSAPVVWPVERSGKDRRTTPGRGHGTLSPLHTTRGRRRFRPKRSRLASTFRACARLASRPTMSGEAYRAVRSHASQSSLNSPGRVRRLGPLEHDTRQAVRHRPRRALPRTSPR